MVEKYFYLVCEKLQILRKKIKQMQILMRRLKVNIQGKGIDSVDSNIEECKKLESHEESRTETISNSTEDEPVIDDKESNLDNDEKNLSAMIKEVLEIIFS